jgi:hypothetical protein
MARPHAQLSGNVREQARLRGDACAARTGSVSTAGRWRAEFPVAGSTDFAAEHFGHQLHAVTDAENGNVEPKIAASHFGAPASETLLRPPEESARWTFRADRVERRVERNDLGIHRQLSQPTRDELRVLRAEVEHENRLMRHSQGIGWETLL